MLVAKKRKLGVVKPVKTVTLSARAVLQEAFSVLSKRNAQFARSR